MNVKEKVELLGELVSAWEEQHGDDNKAFRYLGWFWREPIYLEDKNTVHITLAIADDKVWMDAAHKWSYQSMGLSPEDSMKFIDLAIETLTPNPAMKQLNEFMESFRDRIVEHSAERDRKEKEREKDREARSQIK